MQGIRWLILSSAFLELALFDCTTSRAWGENITSAAWTEETASRAEDYKTINKTKADCAVNSVGTDVHSAQQPYAYSAYLEHVRSRYLEHAEYLAYAGYSKYVGSSENSEYLEHAGYSENPSSIAEALPLNNSSQLDQSALQLNMSSGMQSPLNQNSHYFKYSQFSLEQSFIAEHTFSQSHDLTNALGHNLTSRSSRDLAKDPSHNLANLQSRPSQIFTLATSSEISNSDSEPSNFSHRGSQPLFIEPSTTIKITNTKERGMNQDSKQSLKAISEEHSSKPIYDEQSIDQIPDEKPITQISDKQPLAPSPYNQSIKQTPAQQSLTQQTDIQSSKPIPEVVRVYFDDFGVKYCGTYKGYDVYTADIKPAKGSNFVFTGYPSYILWSAAHPDAIKHVLDLDLSLSRALYEQKSQDGCTEHEAFDQSEEQKESDSQDKDEYHKDYED